MPMECENAFCVYWKKSRCTLSAISVDILGRCRDCTLLNLERELLEARRQEMLEGFEKMRLAWNSPRRRTR